MKPVFLAFFLLFALSTTLPSTIADDLVYDTEGWPLSIGLDYHIVPVYSGSGGGFEVAITGNETSCPLTVVQASSDFNPGLPATFSSPILLSSKIVLPSISERMPLSISFTKVPNCVPDQSEWEVVDEFPIGWSVKLANESSVSPFRIEKYDKYGPRDYKIVYCPGGGHVCADLGIHNRLLVVRDGNPFIVHFRKVGLGRNIV